MKQILFMISICLSVYCNRANAQQIQYDLRGLPIKEVSYTEVEGNPYLINDWVSGSVILKDNKTYAAKLKYDIYSSYLLFQGKNGETLELEDKPGSFSLTNINSEVSDISPLVFVKGFPAIGERTENSWYQLIANGKVKLLKYYKKTIKEDKPFTSATTTRSFISFQFYYVFRNNQLTAIQINKKSLLKLFDDHPGQLDTYLKANNINLKSDAGLQQLFAWYNGLN